MDNELFKVLWMSKKTGALRTFIFDAYVDDPQNKRMLFTDTDNDKVLTLFYDDMSHIITSPWADIN